MLRLKLSLFSYLVVVGHHNAGTAVDQAKLEGVCTMYEQKVAHLSIIS